MYAAASPTAGAPARGRSLLCRGARCCGSISARSLSHLWRTCERFLAGKEEGAPRNINKIWPPCKQKAAAAAATTAVCCRSDHLVCHLRQALLQTPADGRLFLSDVESGQKESQPPVSTPACQRSLSVSGGILGSFNEVFASLMGECDGGDLGAGWPGCCSWNETLDADKINIVLKPANGQKVLCLSFTPSIYLWNL